MLILDRNPIARSMLRTLLEPKTASLRFAATTEEMLAMIEEGGVTHLLLDEATLKAGDDAPIEAVATLAAAGGSAKCAVLWMKPDAELQSQLLATGIGQIIEKPIAGAALVAALITDTEENSGPEDRDPLVSQAA
jgi:DNA-binding NarL/FixJ family response regulator